MLDLTLGYVKMLLKVNLTFLTLCSALVNSESIFFKGREQIHTIAFSSCFILVGHTHLINLMVKIKSHPTFFPPSIKFLLRNMSQYGSKIGYKWHFTLTLSLTIW